MASAARLIKEDREGALSFLEVAANMDEAFADAEEKRSTAELGGPFHELSDFVMEFLNELRELDPKNFEYRFSSMRSPFEHWFPMGMS